MLDVTDHAGTPVTHGRKTVNGVRLHYVTAGSGPALVLLHGVPKTWYYWHRVIPLLTEHFTVIAPDVRGFGDSERPEGGYDMGTIAEDVGALLTELGHETFAVAGEDWGAAFAYAVAATFPERPGAFPELVEGLASPSASGARNPRIRPAPVGSMPTA